MAPSVAAASSASRPRSRNTGSTVRTAKGKPTKTNATTTPAGVKATCQPVSVASGAPSQPFGAKSAVSAIPATAVAGVALTAVCAPDGLAGRAAAEFGVKLAFTPAGVFIALLFIGLPFVVRTVQPVLADLEPELEEAAALLGVSRWRAVTRVVLPALAPAAAAGLALAFARAVGEYGSVIFIAGNMPMVSEIAPLLIVVRLEEYDYGAAAAIAAVMLAASLVLLAVGAVLQRRLEREEAR